MLRPALRPPMRAPMRSANATREGVGVWWDTAALVDANFSGGKFRFNNANYADETAWLAAIGGSKSGIARTIGPYIFGSELFPDGGFTSGVDSWADAPATAANGGVTNEAGRLRLTYTGAGTSYNARRQFTVTANRAYAYRATVAARSGVNLTSMAPAIAVSDDLANGAVWYANGAALPETRTIAFGAQFGTIRAGIQTSGTASAANWAEIDDVSLRECYPYEGFTTQSIGARFEFTTPAAASGNKVLAEWSDDNSSRVSRVRVVFDATSHLRMIVTSDNSEQANLDLGVVAVSTAYELAIAAASNRFSASLDGAAIVTDTAGTMPGVGKLWIGRSVSGETWDGTIDRVRIYAEALSDAALTDPFESFMVFGDSTADASTWRTALAASYTPVRSQTEAAVGGENTTEMLARVAADTDHRRWTTLFMDRPNTGESSATWLGNMKAAAALLETNRWLVVPPVLNSPSGLPDSSATAIGEIQAALLSDPDFLGHTFDASEQAAYISEMADDATRVGGGDWVHFNTTGQNLQAARIKITLDALGW